MIVGRLRKAHGVRGDLVVEPITDEPAEVYTAGRRLFVGTATGDPLPDGRQFTVQHAERWYNGVFLVHFNEVPDRTHAERWHGHYLLLEADQLTPPAAGEVYVHELPGMRVLLASGQPLGEVTEVYELPQGIALEIGAETNRVLLPFREEFVIRVDRAARQIVVAPPEGLFE
jgi:16S rRNA processing protein RimM